MFGVSFNASYFYPVPKSVSVFIKYFIHHQMLPQKPRGRRPDQETTKWKFTKINERAPDKLLLRSSPGVFDWPQKLAAEFPIMYQKLYDLFSSLVN